MYGQEAHLRWPEDRATLRLPNKVWQVFLSAPIGHQVIQTELPGTCPLPCSPWQMPACQALPSAGPRARSGGPYPGGLPGLALAAGMLTGFSDMLQVQRNGAPHLKHGGKATLLM